jgi:hypothetical protein
MLGMTVSDDPNNPLGLFPTLVASNLTSVLRGRHEGCVLLPTLDVFMCRVPGGLRVEAECPGMVRATGKDILPLLQHVRALGYQVRRVRVKRRHPADLIFEIRYQGGFSGGMHRDGDSSWIEFDVDPPMQATFENADRPVRRGPRGDAGRLTSAHMRRRDMTG